MGKVFTMVGSGGGGSAVVIVTAPTGSTVTMTKGGVTKTATESAGIWKFMFTSAEFGTWVATATKGTHTATDEILVDSEGTLYITLAYTKIYGISRDVTSSNPAWVRTDDAVGFTFSASVGSTAGHSDFDNCYPWSQIARETLSTGDVMVKIPKFWYKRWLDGNTEHIQIADRQNEGFAVHPMFMYGDKEVDYCYVGAYITANGYVSQTGKAPLVYIKRSDARVGSKNKGAGWSQLDFSANCGIILLALIETASNNIQATVGKGYSNSSNTGAINSGSCDGVPGLTGRPAGTEDRVGVVYRGIENFWGNVWQWVDGINMNGRTPYICLDPSKYADDTTSNYTQLSYNIGSTSYNQSYISREGLDTNNPFAMMPTSAGGSETTYYCDAVWSATGWRVCFHGGGRADAGACGLFAVVVDGASSYAFSHLGARLLYRPIQ